MEKNKIIEKNGVIYNDGSVSPFASESPDLFVTGEVLDWDEMVKKGYTECIEKIANEWGYYAYVWIK